MMPLELALCSKMDGLEPQILDQKGEVYRANVPESSHMLLIHPYRCAEGDSIPSLYFPGAGTDTVSFEILGETMPGRDELAELLQEENVDFYLMDYDEAQGRGYFVAIDADGPPSGILALPIAGA
ncbi:MULTISPECIES: hypothetical protein [Pseudomonas]|uniref:hypothetical protein n=1 Tax=Pseudomonas TaxID=286 RepID=UPI000F01B9DA|nr:MULTISPECIES: hypothetical protein [Pseudomonas]MBD8615593.1 hypothetical protein [Pseudomonas putida]MBD8681755.1 hypothetical protein [Pseudomonas sp. CFBP 13719]